MARTYVVTGAASGIGATTAHDLRERGERVIARDLRNADVDADLATAERRAVAVSSIVSMNPVEPRIVEACARMDAPGFIDTPVAAYILSDSQSRAAMAGMVPMRVAFPGRSEQMAAMLAWRVSAENSPMMEQVLLVDGGFECLARGERSW